MKATQTAWFIEIRPKRGAPWLVTSTGASTKRGCTQNYLDSCMDVWVSDVERKKAYDEWHERKARGEFRAVRVELKWEASR